jgi:AGZA family xanthine/uracil permease-like MFS transporter
MNLATIDESFPAFITMTTMVLCYSIADGICLGILSYVAMKLCVRKWNDLNPVLLILSVIFILNFIFG